MPGLRQFNTPVPSIASPADGRRKIFHDDGYDRLTRHLAEEVDPQPVDRDCPLLDAQLRPRPDQEFVQEVLTVRSPSSNDCGTGSTAAKTF